MRAGNDVSAAHATDVTDVDYSSCKHIWILLISSHLENVLVCPADVAINR